MKRGLGATLLAAAGYALLGPSATLANVIGIDLGVDFMKVALVARGKPLEIVTNSASKRKTEMAVNFDRGERNFGSDAYALVSRKPKQTYTKMTTMLGRDLDHPFLAPIISRLPNDAEFKAEQGGVVLSLNDNGAEAEYSAVELVAMILSSAQEMTDMFGYSVKDAVITVPEFATAHERRALLDAADLAGLTVLSLMDENTAAALQHAISQTYEEETNVMFYNMGANSVQVTIVTFGPKKIKDRNVGQLTVRGKGWDATVGGWWFDLKLTDVFAEGFNAKWSKGDVRDFPRPMGKMITQATKVKKVLSANAEIPVTLNSLHDDVDYSSTVSRASFEDASKDLFERVTGPIDRALQQAGMKLSDINEVEIIGGGSRIPKVRETLSRYLSMGVDQPLSLGAHLNGDESPCLGAAFRGANLSRAFDVRKVGMTDITPWGVDLSFADLESTGFKGVLGGLFGGGKKDGDGSSTTLRAAGTVFKRASLYGENTPLPLKKTLSITRSEDFEVNVTYAASLEGADTQLPEGTESMIGSYQVTGVAKFAKEMEEEGRGAPKVSLRFISGIAGVPELASAEAFVEFDKNVTYTENEVVEDDEEGIETTKQDTEGETANLVTDPESQSREDSKEEVGADATGDAADSTDKEGDEAVADVADATDTEDGMGGKGADTTKKEKSQKKKKKTIKVTKTKTVSERKKAVLDVVSHYMYMPIHPLTSEGKLASKAKLSALTAADDIRRETSQAKNDLESYILKVRAALRDFDANLGVVSTEEQREEAIALATEQEEWLYDDGWDMDAATYRKKRAELAEMAEAIFFRSSELVARPAELSRGREFTMKVRESVEKWEKTKPQITGQERLDVMEKIDSAEKWMSDKEEEQEALPAHEAPVFKSSEVEPALKALKNLVAKLSKKPAPKKEKPAKAENSTEESASGEGSGASPEGASGGKAGEGDDVDGENSEVGGGADMDTEGKTDSVREDEL